MGKKGKQKGQYSTKAKNAAYLYDQLNQYTTYHHHNSHDKHKINSNRSKNNELTRFKSERGAVSLSILRGILREREIEERERDANYRRQLMTASINQNRKKLVNRDHDDTQMINDSIGWTLTYNYREAMAGIEQPRYGICETLQLNIMPKQSLNDNAPSLQLLCIRKLAPFLQQYIDAFGEDYIIERLRLLPSNVISALSISCTEVTDQMVHVLGKQSAEALVFCAPLSSTTSYEAHNDDDEYHDGARSTSNFTDNGLCSLISSLQNYNINDENNYKSISDALFEPNEEIESWEEYQDHDEICSFQNAKHLKRLELRNFQTNCGDIFIKYLKANPQITHLSISRSFNAISGPQVLFLDDNDNYYHQEVEDRNSHGNMTLLNVLVNLQVLDLTHCQWVNFDLLQLFIQKILNQFSSSYISLELIVIDHCCSYLIQKYEILNRMTGDKKPRICVKIP